MEIVRNLWAAIGARWGAWSAQQRFLLVGSSAALVLAVAIAALLASHVRYAMLFTGMDPEQARVVVERLRELKVVHQLEDGGRTILVPREEVYTLRVELAGVAAPGGSRAGYELFDRSRFGMTGFAERLNYQRALEGELARTIASLEEIRAARVHLVIPERSLFLDNARHVTGAVMLQLEPGVHLTRQQISGITGLVAGSVEGLQSNNVSVLDEFGNLLNTKKDEDGFAVEGGRHEVELAVAQMLEEKASQLLAPIVGPGNAVVGARVELDFEKLERDSETYDADGAVVRSEELVEQTGGADGSNSTNTVTNYEIPHTVERVQKVPGSIKRLTFSVAVDGRYEKVAGKREPQFVEREAQELQQLELTLKNAVGFDATRGDDFHLTCVKFDHHPLKDEQHALQTAQRMQLVQQIANKAIWVLLAVVAIVGVRKFTRSVTRALSPPPVAVGAASADLPAGPDVAARAQAEEPKEANTTRGAVWRTARDRPEESAAVLRSMLQDG